jgi:hypothetical protein
MATLTWTQVQTWFDKNANKHKSLSSYTPTKESIEGPVIQTDEYGWVTSALTPCTPLSAILAVQDPLYTANPESARRGFLRDETTDLQEKAVLHLKGRSWPVRRTSEGIVACGLEEGRSISWPDMGWRALCALRECQILILNQEKKQIRFFPDNVSTWSNSIDTFCVDHECRSVSTNANVNTILHSWLLKKEEEGWTISWPLVEGTMDYLKTELSKYKEAIPSKSSKDALVKKLGRTMCLHTLSNWVESIA